MLVGVELRQLRAFVAVVDEGSFTQAADRLHLVQSSVSAAIRSLEAELGKRLFDRSTRSVRLSDAGHALLPEARRILAAVAAGRDAVAQVDSGLRGSIVLGTMQAQAMHAISVPKLLEAFHADHPGVQVSVRHAGGSLEIGRHVREGRLDLAFLSSTDDHLPGLLLTPLRSEPMMLACAPEHPLAQLRHVDLTALTDQSFIELPTGWGTRMVADQAFAAHGMRRTITYEVNDTASVLEFVRAGIAVALLPPSIATHAPELTLIPIRGQAPTFDVFLATPADRRTSAATQALIAAIDPDRQAPRQVKERS